MQQNVTADEIRALKPGESREFELPSPKAVNSAARMCNYVRNIDGMSITAQTDYKNWKITITRL